jgi:hypothetical protein
MAEAEALAQCLRIARLRSGIRLQAIVFAIQAPVSSRTIRALSEYATYLSQATFPHIIFPF